MIDANKPLEEMTDAELEQLINANSEQATDQTLPEGGESDSITTTTEQHDADPIDSIFAKHGLAGRYKVKGTDAVDELARSYAELEQHKKRIEEENAQYRSNIANELLELKRLQVAQQQQLQQAQQRQEAEPDEFSDDPEAQKGAEFVRRVVNPHLRKLEGQLAQTNQALQYSQMVNDTMAYAGSRAVKDNEFADAFYSGKIGQEIDKYGLPPTRQNVELIFAKLQRDSEPQRVAKNRADIEQEVAKRADAKRKAQVESGGKRQSITPASSIEALTKEIMREDLSADEAERILTEKYKVPMKK